MTTISTPALNEQITKIVLACTTINDEQKTALLQRLEAGLTDDLVADIDRLCDEEIAATEQSIADAEALLVETEEELRLEESIAAPAMERLADEAVAEIAAIEDETDAEGKKLERDFFALIESDRTVGEQAEADAIRAQLKKAA